MQHGDSDAQSNKDDDDDEPAQCEAGSPVTAFSNSTPAPPLASPRLPPKRTHRNP